MPINYHAYYICISYLIMPLYFFSNQWHNVDMNFKTDLTDVEGIAFMFIFLSNQKVKDFFSQGQRWDQFFPTGKGGYQIFITYAKGGRPEDPQTAPPPGKKW